MVLTSTTRIALLLDDEFAEMNEEINVVDSTTQGNV